MFRMKPVRLRYIDGDEGGAAGVVTPDPTDAPSADAPSTDAPQGETPPEAPVEDKPKLSYEDMEAALSAARHEAGGYRQRLRDAESRLEKAKSPEDFEAALSELREQNAALERALLVGKVADTFNLPADLAGLLKGDTEDELKAHAKVLAKYATPGTPADPTGGLTPDDPNRDLESLTPAELAKRIAASR